MFWFIRKLHTQTEKRTVRLHPPTRMQEHSIPLCQPAQTAGFGRWQGIQAAGGRIPQPAQSVFIQAQGHLRGIG